MLRSKLISGVAVAALALGASAWAQTQTGQGAQQQGQQGQAQQDQGQQGQVQGQQGQAQQGQQGQAQQGQAQQGQQGQQGQAQQGQSQQGQQGQQGQAQQGQAQQSQAQQSQQQAQSGQQQTQKEGAKLYIDASLVREVQQSLNQQGFDVGEVDGELGENSSSALKNFQTENNLAATGDLTVETIQALGVDLGRALAEQQGGGEAGGKPVELKVGPDLVRQVQQRLNEEGFDVGEVNGEWSDETSTAAQNFQTERGMTATGNLNVALLQELGISLQGGAVQSSSQGGQQQANAGSNVQGTTLYLAPDLVRQVKMELNRQGFDAGNVDAEWNEEARTALKNFLQAQGLGESEELTVSALSTLGIDWQSGGGTQTQGGSQTQGGAIQVQPDTKEIEADVKVIQ